MAISPSLLLLGCGAVSLAAMNPLVRMANIINQEAANTELYYETQNENSS
jgi:hypothetical protein